MHHAAIDLSTSTPVETYVKWSPRATLALIATTTVGSWTLIIMGFRALI